MNFNTLSWAAVLFYYRSAGDKQYGKIVSDVSFLERLRRRPESVDPEEFEKKVILDLVRVAVSPFSLTTSKTVPFKAETDTNASLPYSMALKTSPVFAWSSLPSRAARPEAPACSERHRSRHHGALFLDEAQQQWQTRV